MKRLCLVLSFWAVHAACGGPEWEETAQGAVSESAARLLFARGVSECPQQNGYCGTALGRVVGAIEVRNIAYQKEVVVHYTSRSFQSWRDVHARYAGSTHSGYEAWRFETEEASYSSRLSADFQFAIRYTVAGQTFWDNNGRQDYRVSTGPRPLYPERILGAAQVALVEANASVDTDGTTSFYGRLLVKDLAYDKTIRVVFTTDGWSTVRELRGSYMHPTGNDSELWMFESKVPATSEIEFALGYVVLGKTYWDNNFDENYVVSVPGQIR